MSIVTTLLLAAPFLSVSTQEASWIRYAKISPDGEMIAFAYAGDLWVAQVSKDANPVEAELLTTHVGYESHPVWAPDSKTIAFAADWHGQMDVFRTTIERAPAERLTFHSGDDLPTSFTPDGKEVWFTSRRQDSVQARIGSAALSELYSVSAQGGAPRRLLTTPAEHAQLNDDGALVVYQDLKGYENEWRKHHVSSVTRDLWTWAPASGKHEKLTSFRGEDREPVWLPDSNEIAFLSERGGNSNIWTARVGRFSQARQVTDHDTHPVRFLSVADDGTLAYTFNGELYILFEGENARRMPIVARVDHRANLLTRETLRDGATEMAVSPDEDEVAFIAHGEVFVASLDHGTTRRVTETPEQERSVTWAKDGRTLYYASERNESWNLYSATIVRDEEEDFSGATLLKEEELLTNASETFQPLVSPDGKHLAFLLDREAIHVMDLETKEHKEIVSADWNYSYSDGDISYSWSHDSLWLTFSYTPNNRWTIDAGMVNLASGDIINASSSGYDVSSSRFSPDGKVVYYTSGRYGQQEHSGRGGQADVLGVYLTQAGYDKALLDWEELEQEQEREKKAKDEEAKKEKAEKKAAAEEKGGEDSEDGGSDEEAKGDEDADDEEEDEEEDAVEPLEFESQRLDERRRRLTMQSAPIGDVVMTPNGEAVIYMAEVDGKWDVWTSHLRDRKTQRLFAVGSNAQLHLTKDGKTLVVRTERGKIMKAKLSLGEHDLPESAKPKPVSYAAEMTVDGPAERGQMFEHVWRQVRGKFYRSDLHGVDWAAMKKNYAGFLPHVYNGRDFAQLLSEMLGELNASHTGGRYRPKISERDDTASLGLIYGQLDENGLEVTEIVERGPADRAETKLAVGARITAIDGKPLSPDENPWPLLDRKSKKPVLLSFRTSDGEDVDEVIRPISARAESELMYKRWIERCEELVDELSGGRVGYVHVRGMNDSSYREVYEQVLGRCSDREALIVDTRWNGGGWLHDQLVTFLGGDQYCQLVPRGKEPGRFGGEPLSRWSNPVCVVQNEGNYSDAHFFPYSFQTLGLGKLIGTPVAGTATAVWWERLFDGATVFGIPQVGVLDTNGEYLENQELFPDIEVYNDPESIAAGRDKQLEAAVKHMLEEVDRARPSNASAGTKQR